MKIALFIFRFGPSHGSILQTYALTRTLEGMGHEVTIIDRQRPITLNDYNVCMRRVVKGLLKGQFSWHDFYLGSFSQYMMKKLNVFIDKELRHQTITLTSDIKLKKIGKGDYDAYIVGSDQTWRPRYVYNIYNYYLDFVPQERDVKRVAYAVSFGSSEWEYSEAEERRCKELVRLFNGVSVREDDAVKTCKNHFDINAQHVLDPTMLLTADAYYKIIGKKDAVKEKYVGYNYLDFTDEKMKMVSRISEALELPARQINSMTENPTAKVKDKVAPSIEEWMGGIANSEFVIVDSFHATVFAIIFHKNFVTVGNERRGLARFTSLLRMFGLEDRLVLGDELNMKQLENNIDWGKVERKMDEMRYSSKAYLRNQLESI